MRSKKGEMGMKTKFMAAVAMVAVVAASGAARAEDASGVKALRAQAAELKKQNAALEQRLSKLEGQQQAAPASGDFMAQITKGPIAVIEDDGPICWKGICINGAVDGGLGYATHGQPLNGKYYNGNQMITGRANRPYFGFSPNNLGQTQLGIKGAVEILPGISGVFTANTLFNPHSGQLQNAPGSLVDNNGLPAAATSLSADGSRGGQAFNDQLNVGLSSKEFGTLTFGRHRNLSTDLLVAYDATGASSAFSFNGYSGAYMAGLAFTGDARWDNSLKYKLVYGPVRFGAMYKFIDGNSGTNLAGGSLKRQNDAAQFSLGASFAGLDIDGVLGFYNQATTGASLDAAQLNGVRRFNGATDGVVYNNAGTLSGIAADATGGAIGAKYTWNQFKLYAGWSHIILHNPKDPVGIGAQNDQGGYVYSSINNQFFPRARVLDSEWVGVRYAYNPKTDIVVQYVHANSNSFYAAAPGGAAACSAPKTTRSTQCSGSIDQVGAFIDYRFTKRFDVYGGVSWSTVGGGLAARSNYSTNWAPTVGARFAF
jgi:predicted porin